MFIRFASGVNSVQPNTTNIVQSRTLYSMEVHAYGMEIQAWSMEVQKYGNVIIKIQYSGKRDCDE